MPIREILLRLDAEIELLQRARKMLVTGRLPARARTPAAAKRRIGAGLVAKRSLSEEGRARIVEAQRRRWAATKRAGK